MGVLLCAALCLLAAPTCLSAKEWRVTVGKDIYPGVPCAHPDRCDLRGALMAAGSGDTVLVEVVCTLTHALEVDGSSRKGPLTVKAAAPITVQAAPVMPPGSPSPFLVVTNWEPARNGLFEVANLDLVGFGGRSVICLSTYLGLGCLQSHRASMARRPKEGLESQRALWLGNTTIQQSSTTSALIELYHATGAFSQLALVNCSLKGNRVGPSLDNKPVYGINTNGDLVATGGTAITGNTLRSGSMGGVLLFSGNRLFTAGVRVVGNTLKSSSDSCTLIQGQVVILLNTRVAKNVLPSEPWTFGVNGNVSVSITNSIIVDTIGESIDVFSPGLVKVDKSILTKTNGDPFWIRSEGGLVYNRNPQDPHSMNFTNRDFADCSAARRPNSPLPCGAGPCETLFQAPGHPVGYIC